MRIPYIFNVIEEVDKNTTLIVDATDAPKGAGISRAVYEYFKGTNYVACPQGAQP